MEKLQTAENTLENLLRDLARIEEDLAIKTNSLDLDYKCMDMRKKLVEPQHDIEANDITDAQGTKQRTSSAKDKQVTIDRGSPQATRTNASPLKRSSLSRNIPLNGQTQIDTSQAGRLSQLEKDFLQTTYKASYDGRTNLRSGDLNRTLGKLSIADTHGNETRNKRQVLVD